MKLIYTLFSILFLSVLTYTPIFAQTEKGSEKTTATKEQQIAALEDIISRCQDPKETAKAKEMLEALKNGKTSPKGKLSDQEEQKLMSETLSPAEYDAWKAAKHAPKTNPTTLISKPEEKN